MKPKQITVEHTFQIRQYEPVKISITADVTDDENIMECAKKLQEMVIMICLKHDPKQRDHLINSLVYPERKQA